MPHVPTIIILHIKIANTIFMTRNIIKANKTHNETDIDATEKQK